MIAVSPKTAPAPPDKDGSKILHAISAFVITAQPESGAQRHDLLRLTLAQEVFLPEAVTKFIFVIVRMERFFDPVVTAC
jgi:hypothetical protein